MSDNDLNGKTDPFLEQLEASVLSILKAKKGTKGEKIAAITAGVRIAQIKHKMNGGDDDKGFFSK